MQVENPYFLEPLSDEQIAPLLTEVKMRKGKKNWGYRCPNCKQKFNQKTHGKYVLIDTFELNHTYDLGLSNVDESSLFCSKDCASETIKSMNLVTMYKDSQYVIQKLLDDMQDMYYNERRLRAIKAHIQDSTNYTTQEVQAYAQFLLEQLEPIAKKAQKASSD